MSYGPDPQDERDWIHCGEPFYSDGTPYDTQCPDCTEVAQGDYWDREIAHRKEAQSE